MANRKFWLEMADKHQVSSLGELQQHGDKASVLRYFKDGTLERWLDAYEYDELEDVKSIPKGAPDAAERLKEILRLSWPEDDTATLKQEKEAKLRQWTNDREILSKADSVAFHDGDLIELLRKGCRTVYLCAKEDSIFNIRLKYNGIKYIGILGTPRVETRAVSSEDLAEYGITVENVNMPWGRDGKAPVHETSEYKNISAGKTSGSKTMNRLRECFRKTFNREPGWEVMNEDSMELDEIYIEIILKRLGVELKNILHVAVARNLSQGWALTDNAIVAIGESKFLSVPEAVRNSTTLFTDFSFSGMDPSANILRDKIPEVEAKTQICYKDITDISYRGDSPITCKDGNQWMFFLSPDLMLSIIRFNFSYLSEEIAMYEKLYMFLGFAKDL